MSNSPANTRQSESEGHGEASQTQAALTAEGIQELVMTEFGRLFRYDEKTVSPAYLVGDLNGDRIKDIVIIARLREENDLHTLSRLPFNLWKPLGTGGEPGKDVAGYEFTPQDLSQYVQESMVLIVHGMPGNLWRTNQPQKRFVLLDALYGDSKTMKLYRGKLKPAFAGDERKPVTPPSLKGDAILFLSPDGTGVAIYWDGKRYRWYPVEDRLK